MRVESDGCVSTETTRGLLKDFLDGLFVLLTYLRWLKAAQLAFDRDGCGDSVARAAAKNMANVDACLVVGQRAMDIVGGAKDVDGVNSLRQVFARMPGAAGDLNIEGLVGGAFGDDDTCFEGVIEDDTVGDVPRCTVKA